MSEKLDEAKQEAEEVQVPPLEGAESTPDQLYGDTDDNWIYDLAELYPRSAVIEAWLRVEHETRELARKLDLVPPDRRTSTVRLLKS